MLVKDFSFELPEQLIASEPQAERSASRLLCMNRQSGELSHQIFKDILQLLNPGDLLLFNNTRVIPARLFGQKDSGGRVEVLVERLLSEQRSERAWQQRYAAYQQELANLNQLIDTEQNRIKLMAGYDVVAYSPGTVQELLAPQGTLVQAG